MKQNLLLWILCPNKSLETVCIKENDLPVLKILLTSLISQFFLKRKKKMKEEEKQRKRKKEKNFCAILRLTEIILLQEPAVA